MTAELILIPALALFNALRGCKAISRINFAAACGFATSFIHGLVHGEWFSSVVFGVIVSLGMLIWAAPGWGRYFTVMHGRKHVLLEREVAWIDYIADSTTKNPYLNGFIGMSLRGLYALPMFIALGWFNVHAPFIGLLCSLQGAIYWLAGRVSQRAGARIAETLVGGGIAALITIII